MSDPYATNADPSFPDLADTNTSAEPELPGYALIGMLGAGACGVVYRARQHALNREVAVKTIEVDGDIPAQVLARFEKEAQALARLKHPNIVQVYEFGRKSQRVFLAMELLDGQDLEKRIQTAGPMDETLAWRIARQTAAALAHAAAVGVFHRDVKPANLFLVPPPTGFPLPAGVPMVKVTDFGLALTRDSTEGTDQRLTRPGVTLGTPVYMAPEQFASPDVDHRADIYALGVTVCQMLTGHTPYDGATVWEVMKRKAQPPTLPATSSVGTRALLIDMLAADPEERVSSYDELLTRIDGVLAGDAPPPPKAGGERPALVTSSKTKLTRRAALAALGVAALGGVAAVVLSRRRRGGRVVLPQPESEVLFDGSSLAGWNWAGGSWTVGDGFEGAKVLSGDVPIRRAVIGGPAFRLAMGLDLHQATGAEVSLGPAKITLGRTAADGVVVFPARKPEQSPVAEVRFERTGGNWAVYLDRQPAGTVPDDGRPGPFELTITPIGGAVRIESALSEPMN